MPHELVPCITLAAAGVAAFSSFAFGAANAGRLTLTSAEAANGKMMAMEQVLNDFGCSGANVSPGLKWSDPPAGTKSFVLTVYDPDAPTGSGWWHWVVVDIPANARELPKASAKTAPSRYPAARVRRVPIAARPAMAAPVRRRASPIAMSSP
jgi:phosphatidylethanolamine-binding protein (PEBP) family uncharacterized protein